MLENIGKVTIHFFWSTDTGILTAYDLSDRVVFECSLKRHRMERLIMALDGIVDLGRTSKEY